MEAMVRCVEEFEQRNPTSHIFFEKGEFYTCIQSTAARVASLVYHSNAVLKYAKVNREQVPFINLSKKVFSDLIRRLLLSNSEYVATFALNLETQMWRLHRSASPGILHDFEQELKNSDPYSQSSLEESSVGMICQMSRSECGICIANTTLRTIGICELGEHEIAGFLLQEGVQQCFFCQRWPEKSVLAQQVQILKNANVLISIPEQRIPLQLILNADTYSLIQPLLGRDFPSQLDSAFLNRANSCQEIKGALFHMVKLLERPVLRMEQAVDFGTNFRPVMLKTTDTMFLPPSSVEALSLFPVSLNKRKRSAKASLFELFAQFCRSPMGKRLLLRWIRRPSMELLELNNRQEIVQKMIEEPNLKQEIKLHLKWVPDGERLALSLQHLLQSKEKSGSSTIASDSFDHSNFVKKSLSNLLGLYKIIKISGILLQALKRPLGTSTWQVFCKDVAYNLAECSGFISSMDRSIDTTQLQHRPISSHEYHARIRPALSPELTILHSRIQSLQDKIISGALDFAQRVSNIDTVRIRICGTKSEISIRPPTANIGNVKRKSQRKAVVLNLEQNSVHGIFLRLTKIDCELVLTQRNSKRNHPDYNVLSRDKTGVRFRTSALEKSFASFCNLDLQYRRAERDQVIALLTEASGSFHNLLHCTEFIARVDVLGSFAETASLYGYCRPDLLPIGKKQVTVSDARHPLLEQLVGLSKFIPNSFSNVHKTRYSVSGNLIFGPNMGGKSTFIRQIALFAIMAQIGAFVPASEASIPIFDAVLVRIGAKDDAQIGASTFMVEMSDMASILNIATENSLVVIDEIGRGTSVRDGFGLAWSIGKHLSLDVGCVSLIASHFHQLSELSLISMHGKHEPVAQSFHFIAHVNPDGTVIMLYKLLPGSTDQSFGLAVAKMAGFPSEVLIRAGEELGRLMAA